jgi:hypothetical protein
MCFIGLPGSPLSMIYRRGGGTPYYFHYVLPPWPKPMRSMSWMGSSICLWLTVDAKTQLWLVSRKNRLSEEHIGPANLIKALSACGWYLWSKQENDCCSHKKFLLMTPKKSPYILFVLDGLDVETKGEADGTSVLPHWSSSQLLSYQSCRSPWKLRHQTWTNNNT